MRIIINALSGIGDALMFTPALQLLRKAFPQAQIDAMVMYEGVHSFYERLEEINSVHYFDFLNSNPFDALKFVLSLRGRYDASINVYPSNRKEYNIINFLLGAKKRGGVRYLRNDFANLGFLNNASVIEDDNLHNVEENVLLAEKIAGKNFGEIPPLKFPLFEEEKNFADSYINSLNVNEGRKIIGFHTGCSTLKNHIKRRWEPEKFAALAKNIIQERNVAVLLFGGKDELELNRSILKMSGGKNVFVVEAKSLVQSASIMNKCDLFITNDSGLMHIAAALNLKIIPIIGPTNMNYIHPWKAEYFTASLNLECSPCFYYSPKPLTCYRNDVEFKCLKELSVDYVLGIVNKVLGNK